MSKGTVKVRVKIAALYVDGRSYPAGAAVAVSEADAKVLLGRGEAEKA
jgi:hypothetical protein